VFFDIDEIAANDEFFGKGTKGPILRIGQLVDCSRVGDMIVPCNTAVGFCEIMHEFCIYLSDFPINTYEKEGVPLAV
jgi:hypothetical protein